MAYPTKVAAGNRKASAVYWPTWAMSGLSGLLTRCASALDLRPGDGSSLGFQQSFGALGGFLHQVSHLGMAGLEVRMDPVVLERFGGRRSDGSDQHLREGSAHIVFQAFFRGYAQQVLD